MRFYNIWFRYIWWSNQRMTYRKPSSVVRKQVQLLNPVAKHGIGERPLLIYIPGLLIVLVQACACMAMHLQMQIMQDVSC
jgi:hypothetical protein